MGAKKIFISTIMERQLNSSLLRDEHMVESELWNNVAYRIADNGIIIYTWLKSGKVQLLPIAYKDVKTFCKELTDVCETFCDV